MKCFRDFVASCLTLAAIIGGAQHAEADLIDFWSGNGNANDSVGSNSGTWNGTEQYGASQQAGAKAFLFDGSSSVQAGSLGLPTGNADRTLNLWFNVATTPSGDAVYAGYGQFGNINQSFQLGSNSSIEFFSQWGGSISTPAVANNTWNDLAVTYSGNTATLYLNGASVASGTFNLGTASNTTFVIGMLDPIRALTGLVDDVGIYDTALSASEVQALYVSETLPVPEPSSFSLLCLGFIGLAIGGVIQRRRG